jgi:hypothetical protein
LGVYYEQVNREVSMNKRLAPAFVIPLLLAVSHPAPAGELKLTFADGRVSLVAEDVPVAQILREWARLGGTKIVNLEKLAGGPVTLQFADVPEGQALETLLRAVSGYIVAPRAQAAAGQSMYDRILILAISNAPAAGTPAPGPAAGRPDGSAVPNNFLQFQQGRPGPPAGDASQPGTVTAPVMMPGSGPPETRFDYANPPQLRQLMQQQQQQQAAPATPAGMVIPGFPTGQTPAAPGTGGQTPATATKPGVPVGQSPQANPANFTNPYGLPSNVLPGSVIGPPQEPDRSKYTNPPKPPGTPGGN